jgi:outer membrane protein assembly factor BamB
MYQERPDHNAVITGVAGAHMWTYRAGSRINSGLAIVRNSIIFDTFGGQVVSLNATTGEVRWIAHADNIIMSTPVVDQGIVVVGTGRNGTLGQPPGSLVYDPSHNSDPNEIWGRAEGDHIIALDEATGSTLWRYRTLGEDMPSPVITNGLLIFANGDQHLYALHLRSGKPLWKDDLDGVSTMASANFAMNLVFASACDLSRGTDETLAVRPKGGVVWWRIPGGSCDSAPTIGAGKVFLSGVVTSHKGAWGRGIVEAVHLVSGEPLWRYSADSDGPFSRRGSNERAIAGVWADAAYFQSFPTIGEVVALRGSDGALLWKLHTAAAVKMSPVVAGGRIYFGDILGNFYIVNAATGKLLQTRRYDEGFSVAPPVIVGKTAYLVTTRTVRAVAI